jgi:hypothetical protein
MDKSLFGITKGILCQQCNCKGKYGAGISGAISSVYPEVYFSFKKDYEKYGKDDALFGTTTMVKCTETLSVANIYSQHDYGRRGQYTDIPELVKNIINIAVQNPTTDIYLPHYYNTITGKHTGIGAGLGGGTWEIIEGYLQTAIDHLKIQNIYLYDTINQKIDKHLIPNDVRKDGEKTNEDRN